MRRLLLVLLLTAGALTLPARALPTPGFASPNVEFLANVPLHADTAGAKLLGGWLYVTSSHELSIYDVRNPELPVLTSTVPVPQTPYFSEEDVDTNGKVLLIGTEKLFNDRIKELLPENDDFKYELANSGFEAGILAGSFHPDTIVIDLGLGRAESIQIVSNLRKDEAYATTLIVGLASEDEAAPEQLAQYGFNDVFKKPFDVALLGEKIKSIADAKRED